MCTKFVGNYLKLTKPIDIGGNTYLTGIGVDFPFCYDMNGKKIDNMGQVLQMFCSFSDK